MGGCFHDRLDSLPSDLNAAIYSLVGIGSLFTAPFIAFLFVADWFPLFIFIMLIFILPSTQAAAAAAASTATSAEVDDVFTFID